MSAQSKSARAALKAKAHRLATEKPGKVDASSYTIPDDMHAEAKTGMRPVSKRAFKRGGKVMGEMAEARADRKPRASGGNAAATPDNLINRNDKSGGGFCRKPATYTRRRSKPYQTPDAGIIPNT